MQPALQDGPVSVYLGDALEVLRELPAASVDALVTDPPAGIRFMGRTWDHDHGGRQGWVTAFAAIFRECLRVLKPGAHGLVWAIPRTSHWTATALENAGFEVRDVITHHFGSGFPKSLRVSRDPRFCACDAATEHSDAGKVPEQGGDDHSRMEVPSVSPGQDVLLPNALRDPRTPVDSLAGYPLAAHSDGELLRQAASDDRETAQPRDDVLARSRWRERDDDPLLPAPSHSPSHQGSALPSMPDSDPLVESQHVASEGILASKSQTDQTGSANGSPEPHRPSMDESLSAWPHCTVCGKPQANGWGTALKPASEHWILVRRPLSEPNVAANVLAHGTGAINVDGCRVASVDSLARPINEANNAVYGAYKQFGNPVEPPGRWPANLALSHAEGCRQVGTRRVQSSEGVIKRASAAGYAPNALGAENRPTGTPMVGYGLETVEAWDCAPGCPVAELDRQSGITTSTGGARAPSMGYGHWAGQPDVQCGLGDTGGASRFFYVAKADTAERNQGLPLGYLNRHPTVKPVELMRWLCRLVTPPGGVVLDPFLGSGSTLVAAKLEGFRGIGIDQDPESVEVAKRRLGWAVHEPELFPPPR
jgi:DNA methylase